jgi:ABC-type transporter Mla subunit MlaD
MCAHVKQWSQGNNNLKAHGPHRLENLKEAVTKIRDATIRGKDMRKEAQSQVTVLVNELNEVNKNLQTVFTQLRCVMDLG